MPIDQLDASLASTLTQPRSAFVESTNGGIRIRQTGGAYIEGRFTVPTTPFATTGGQTAIETFVCQPGQSVAAMGDDEQLIELWAGFAQVIADAVYRAAGQFGIALDGPGYLTASALPLPQVSHDPHFDDDLWAPQDGVSIVATISTHGGTRCSTEPIELPATGVGAPIVVPQELKDDFDSGRHPWDEAEAGRLLILPQFGQLHSGPNLETQDPGTLRTLFVFRSRTASDSAAPQRRRRRG